MVSVSGLLLSVVTFLFAFSVFVLVFLRLARQPENGMVYYPALLARGLQPPYEEHFWMTLTRFIRRGLFTTDDEVLSVGGLDAAIYIRFLRMALYINGVAALGGMMFLIPICASGIPNSSKTIAGWNSLDNFSIANVEGSALWVFIIGAYVLAGIVFFFLFTSSEIVCRMCVKFREQPNSHLQQFGILVRDIPSSALAIPAPAAAEADDQVTLSRALQTEKFFRSLYPDDFLACVAIPRMREVLTIEEDLRDCGLRLEKELEGAVPVGQRSWGLLRRGTWWPFTKQPKYSSTQEEFEGLISELQNQWERALASESLTRSLAAFVFFKSRRVATMAAQTVHGFRADTFVVTPAPSPSQVRWHDVTIPVYRRAVMQIFGFVCAALVIVFNYLPVTLISAFSSIVQLEQSLPDLRAVLELPLVKYIVESYLAQVLLLIWNMTVAYIFLFLSEGEQHPTEARVQERATEKLFVYMTLNIFIGFTLTSTVLDSIKQIVNSPKEVFNLLGTSLPRNASFFISFVALRFFVSFGLEVSRLLPWLWLRIHNWFAKGTEAERVRFWAPQRFPFFLYIPSDMLVLMLGLCYAVISPPILIFTTIYFTIALIIYTNQMMDVYHPDPAGNGKMWMIMHYQIMISLLLAEVTLVGYFGLLQSLKSSILFPLIVITVIFMWLGSNRFEPVLLNVPLEVFRGEADDDATNAPSPEELVDAYSPLAIFKRNSLPSIGNRKLGGSQSGDGDAGSTSMGSNDLSQPLMSSP